MSMDAIRRLQASHSSRTAGGGQIQKSRSPGAHSRSGGSLPHPRGSASERHVAVRPKAQAGRGGRARGNNDPVEVSWRWVSVICGCGV